MNQRIELLRPSHLTEELLGHAHRVIAEVAALGGAIGFLSPPDRAQTDALLHEIIRDQHSNLVLAIVGGEVSGMGACRGMPREPFLLCAEIQKVMVHPSARGLGLGKAVLAALLADAESAGFEMLTLGVRGNNHGAIELYEELGFREWGRLPNVIAVGAERFDEVKMCRALGYRADAMLRGGDPVGPGSSRRRGAHGGIGGQVQGSARAAT
ncbi:MAG: GNAT family N-acetyltransferase [Sciscionella sp.]